jgi:NAD(P)H-hydrate epimerase
VQKTYPTQKHPRVLICCGPGNNGGDGLVAARHLFHFGYQPSIYYPKQSKNDLYKVRKMIGCNTSRHKYSFLTSSRSFQRLVTQCNNLDIPFVEKASPRESDVIVDAIFGFSFSGDVRDPFKEVVRDLKETSVPIVAVDIPSGWNVEKGDPENEFFSPDTLVSLTAPKLCAQAFKGRHFIGGRFVPPSLAKKFDLKIPKYPEGDQVVQVQ